MLNAPLEGISCPAIGTDPFPGPDRREPDEVRLRHAQVERVLEAVARARLPLHDEKAAQRMLSDVLTAEGIAHEREVPLGDAGIVDFMLAGGLAVEMKLRQPKRQIHRQCARYCLRPEVSGLVLVTATATGFPPTLHGKPCWVASLGLAWL